MALGGHSRGPMPALIRARGLPFNQELLLATFPRTFVSQRTLIKSVVNEVGWSPAGER